MRLGHDLIAPSRQRCVIGPLEDKANGRTRAALTQTRGHKRHGPNARHLPPLAHQSRSQIEGAVVALIPGRHGNPRERNRGRSGDEKRRYEQHSLQGTLFLQFQQRGLQFVDNGAHGGDIGAFLSGDHRQHRVLIFHGHVLSRQLSEQHGKQQQRRQTQQGSGPGDGEEPLEQRGIDGAQAPDDVLRAPGASLRRSAGPQQLAAQHGHQAQRQQRRHEHSDGDGGGKFQKQARTRVLQKQNGAEHSEQHGGGRDDRKPHLPRPGRRRQQRGLTPFDTPIDVFEHHDGIVHHQPDRQHHGQQRDQIEGKTQHRQSEHGAQKRDGNAHHGDQRRSQGAEEQQYHQRHQRRGHGHSPVDAVDAGADKRRRVPGGGNTQASGEIPFDGEYLGAHGVEHIHRVRPGLFHDADGHAVHTIGEEYAPGRGGPLLDPAHFPQAHEVAVVAATYHQLAKVCGGSVAAPNPHGVLIVRRFQAPGGQFEVFATQGIQHIPHGQGARTQTLPIDPDAHGAGCAAVEIYRGHAGQHRKTIDDIALGVVRDFHHRQARTLNADVDEGLTLAVGLGDPRPLGPFGKASARAGDTIAHVIGRRIDIPV